VLIIRSGFTAGVPRFSLRFQYKNAATDKAHQRRNKISQSVQNAKEKTKEKIDEFREHHSA
jgi:hypothetical protein